MSERFVVGIGSNLGSRWALLRAAVGRIGALEGVTLEAIGRPRRTEALVLPGAPPGPPFLNGVARLRASVGPEALLEGLHAVEAELGRRRAEKWAARTMDLDLLTWSGPPLRSERLALPHAELPNRPFALAGVADVGWGAAEDPAAPFAAAPQLRVEGPTRRVVAADDADALAWALSLAEPAGPFESLTADSVEAFVASVNARAAAAVVIFETAGGIHGATAPGRRADLPRRSVEALGEGRCRIGLDE